MVPDTCKKYLLKNAFFYQEYTYIDGNELPLNGINLKYFAISCDKFFWVYILIHFFIS